MQKKVVKILDNVLTSGVYLWHTLTQNIVTMTHVTKVKYQIFKHPKTKETERLYVGTYGYCTDPNCNCVGSWTVDENRYYAEDEAALINDGFAFLRVETEQEQGA